MTVTHKRFKILSRHVLCIKCYCDLDLWPQNIWESSNDHDQSSYQVFKTLSGHDVANGRTDRRTDRLFHFGCIKINPNSAYQMVINSYLKHSYPCMLKSDRKKRLEIVLPAKLALFIYDLTQYVEIVKYFYFNQYVQLSLWSRANASDCGARGPRFDFLSLARIFYVCLFVSLLLIFLSKTHCFLWNFAFLFQCLFI